MKCALAAMGFINENVQYNKKVIVDTMAKCSRNVDIVIFGEAFLQGFYGATFDTKHDENIAFSQNDLMIKEIAVAAKEYKIAVSFGFIEKEKDWFYSSQMTIDSDGKIIDIYRRVSPGWKEEFACDRYCEGKGFHTFEFYKKKIAIGLCGDLWFEENIRSITETHPDLVFWPVYTDFNYTEWNTAIKYEYAEQASKINAPVLYVNSFCIDKKEECEIAKGGAALFDNGKIVKEISAGKEGILWAECQ